MIANVQATVKQKEKNYLTIKQHDMFRTLLMGFEIPYRAYIAEVITTAYAVDTDFENTMTQKQALLSGSSPQFLRDVLCNAVSKHTLKNTYQKLKLL